MRGGGSVSDSSLLADESALVEELPFRLMLLVLLVGLSVSAASSGLQRITEQRTMMGLEAEIDSLLQVGVAVAASGEGTRVDHIMQLQGQGVISLESLTLGGNVSNPEGTDRPTVYTYRFSTGVEQSRMLGVVGVELSVSDSAGEGFEVDFAGTRTLIQMVAVQCDEGMMLVLLDEKEAKDGGFDIPGFQRDNGCDGEMGAG